VNIINTELPGVIIIEPSVHGDNRGWFMEVFNEKKFVDAEIDIRFVQDNHSFSKNKGTLRGLHYQKNPKPQSKLVRCVRGAIFDVAVDIRKKSSTYGHWVGVELSETNKKQLLVPKGFAHGFMTITDNVEVQYKVDEFYSPENDRTIIWNDPTIDITWPKNIQPILSEKDKIAPLFKNADNNFLIGEGL
jgi:dTDP-4-dehydrorhamnose 3,5-epimerase